MRETLRTLNTLLKEKGVDGNTEVTRFKSEYYLLRILKNNTPIPYLHSKNSAEIRTEIELRF